MKFRTVGRHLKEGTKNLGRNGWMTFASISAVAVMLLVVGMFLLLILNMNHMATQVEDDVEIRTYIELTANEEQQEELRANIEEIGDVQSVTFLGKDEGLSNLIDSLGDGGQAFESVREENPLNDMFVVEANSPQLIESVANEISELGYVDTVNYGQDVVERLLQVTNVGRYIGLGLVVAMMLTAMFLIANTIKLTILARRKEIRIMKLVGATNGFIRWPFFVEGLLLGLIGALLPILLVIYGYSYIYDNYGSQIEGQFFALLPVYPYMLQIALLLLAVGLFIGVWGSTMSVRKFLKV
ncbi:permease-like cell division protein FtsX [Alkalicoccobacillus porphyridii]|uniref:Cell division protein FtsX n=1 Tax=Alkalicoccobacillus porphyridii TaxID=2597270 RepID=A0A554A3S0_9BACI|nr:permease-like cell division protein FtsX [Alkalicoccobacillus porphyridii]TSB48325.1 ABC transporter permease [Alkalicoccobacillus porphyridii]